VKLVVPIYAFAAFLLTLAVPAIVVGVHDAALDRAGVGVTVGSGMLLVFGVALLVATFQLIGLSRRRFWRDGVRPACKPPVLVAFLLTILLGVYVFFSAIRSVGVQRTVVVSVALVLIVVALVGLRFFGREARVTLPRLGTIAVGLVGTTIGAWEFWYQNQYIPSHAGRAVTLKADLQIAREQRTYAVVRARVEYENLGGRSVVVIGSTYTLTGSRVVSCHRAASAAAVARMFSGFLVDPQRTRFMADVWEEQPAAVLAAGKFVPDGKPLDANVPSRRDFVFLVPRGRYQLLRLRAQLFAIPASVQLSRRPAYTKFAGDNDLYGFWPIEDDSWLRDLIYGRERWVVTRYELVSRPQATATSPDLRVTARFPNPTWTERRPRETSVRRLFAELKLTDASEPFADAELALERVAKPTGQDQLPPGC
jgi:hypothetical protein